MRVLPIGSCFAKECSNIGDYHPWYPSSSKANHKGGSLITLPRYGRRDDGILFSTDPLEGVPNYLETEME